MRLKRRGVSKAFRRKASHQLIRQLKHRHLLSAKHIGIYLSTSVEIDTSPLIKTIWAMGKTCYVPVIGPGTSNDMRFYILNPESKLKKNRFGIAEPDPRFGKTKKKQFLDLVLLPLLAFDEHGNRLGMGGGYYDKAFSATHWPLPGKRPRLLGLAYDFQKVETLPTEEWDVKLAGIATEKRFYAMKGN